MELAELISGITPPDGAAMAAAKARWDSIAKPLGSLGLLEDNIVRMAGMTGTADIDLGKRIVLMMCADNGVVAEGVTQTGQEITALVAGNVSRADTSVCRMARVAGAEVRAVDMGMVSPAPGAIDRRVAKGTANMAKGPAMTRRQAGDAILAGAELVAEFKREGYGAFITGEMGIGNTTTSSAVFSVLSGLAPADVTGRGAGLSDDGLKRKISAIERAIAVNRPDASDPVDVLAKVGGFDIAGMVGMYLGGAAYHVPVFIDGFISAVAALLAARICPASLDYMVAVHVSAEPAARLVMEELGLKPMLYAGLRLGEGTGAVCALPLLDMALAVYGEMSTFTGIGMEAYTPQEEKKC